MEKTKTYLKYKWLMITFLFRIHFSAFLIPIDELIVFTFFLWVWFIFKLEFIRFDSDFFFDLSTFQLECLKNLSSNLYHQDLYLKRVFLHFAEYLMVNPHNWNQNLHLANPIGNIGGIKIVLNATMTFKDRRRISFWFWIDFVRNKISKFDSHSSCLRFWMTYHHKLCEQVDLMFISQLFQNKTVF
jgi:hypothetical protein